MSPSRLRSRQHTCTIVSHSSPLGMACAGAVLEAKETYYRACRPREKLARSRFFLTSHGSFSVSLFFFIGRTAT